MLYEARTLAADGVKELIVVAQDISRYGLDLPGHTHLLPQLLRELCKIDGIHWVRLHYLYPDETTDEMIDVIASEPKIVKYLDIPIQHVNDEILKKMNRRGDKAFITALLKSSGRGFLAWCSVPASLPVFRARARRSSRSSAPGSGR